MDQRPEPFASSQPLQTPCHGTIGLAVGVFNLLHHGHLAFLRAARLSCDRLIVPYQAVEDLVQQLPLDRLFLGEDQLHHGFSRAEAHCYSKGIPVIRLPRTPGISSSALRNGQSRRFTVAAPPPT